MSLFGAAHKEIKEQISSTEQRLLNGRFSTLEEARGLVERRRGLMDALEIFINRAKHDDESEEV